MAFQELAEEVKTEARLLETTEAELALHAKDRAKAYAGADPKGLALSLPGIGEGCHRAAQALQQRQAGPLLLRPDA